MSESREDQVQVGERITRQVSFSREEIAAFARLSGDLNPIHHDEDYARHTRFGGVIVSGPQLTSLMMGMVASRYSRETGMLGLEFTFHFRKAVRADETLALEWQMTQAEPKARLHGLMVTLEGQATNDQGQIAVAGR